MLARIRHAEILEDVSAAGFISPFARGSSGQFGGMENAESVEAPEVPNIDSQ